MHNLLSGKPIKVTEKHLKASWGGGKNGKYFKCYFCGYKFQLDDMFRCIYSNHTKAYGNPLVCEKCNDSNENLIEKWKKMHEIANSTMWWFCRNDE